MGDGISSHLPFFEPSSTLFRLIIILLYLKIDIRIKFYLGCMKRAVLVKLNPKQARKEGDKFERENLY